MFGNYLLTTKTAAGLRMKSDIAVGIDRKITEELSIWFHANNPLAKCYKSMDEILQEQKKAGKPTATLTIKIVDKDDWKAKGGKLQQHSGTYREISVSDDYVAMFFTADIDQNVLPRGLNVYQRKGWSMEREIFPWLPIVDPLCYPLFFPHGEPGYSSHKFLKSEPILYKDRIQEPKAKRVLLTEPEEDEVEPTVRVSDNADNVRVYERNEDDIPLSRLRIIMKERGGEFYPTRDTKHPEEPIPTVVGYCDSDDSGDDEYDNLELAGEINHDRQLRFDAENDRLQFEREQIRSADDNVDYGEDISEHRVGPPLLLQDEVEEQNESDEELLSEEPSTSAEPTPRGRRRKYVSMREHALYRHQYRSGIHRYSAFRKLGQVYLIDIMTRIMKQRSDFIGKHFTQTLTSAKKPLLERTQRILDKRGGIRGGPTVGAMTVIPASVPGSPRYMKQKFEEAVLLANVLDPPDLFVTWTANCEWQEIESVLKPGQSWADHPMVVVEVFKKKLDAFLDDVLGKKKKNKSDREPGIFGHVKWFVYSVEFQQRGMPHIHLVLSLENHIKTPAEIDEIVSARLPEVPDDVNHPDYERLAELRFLVESYMIHTPCTGCTTAYCNHNKPAHYRTCLKRFPKLFFEETAMGDKHYPDYYRPDNGDFVIKTNKNNEKVKADNRWVVPYNPQLLLKYQSHVNVEVISTIKVLKYLYKYLFKGTDRVITEAIQEFSIDNGTPFGAVGQMTQTGNILHSKKFAINVVEGMRRGAINFLKSQGIDPKDKHGKDVLWYDERIPFFDMRAMCAPEAAWNICGFPLNGCSHVIATIGVHRPDEEPISFAPGEEEETKISH